MKRIKEFIKSLWNVLRLPEMLILPGNLAFYLILSLPPIISLFGIISSFFNLSTESISSFVGNIIPREVVEILSSFSNGSGLETANIIFVITGFYIASNGSDSLIVASNTLYKKENKNYVFRRIKAIFMTFWLILLFIIVLVFMAFGSFILTKLLSFTVLGSFIINNYFIITLLKILLSFIITFMTIKILYTMAPDTKIKSHYVNYGAFFSTVAIMLVTGIYSFYVTNFAHYDVLYGSLANIAILMLLIYFISYIIVLGIAINHNYYKLDLNK